MNTYKPITYKPILTNCLTHQCEANNLARRIDMNFNMLIEDNTVIDHLLKVLKSRDADGIVLTNLLNQAYPMNILELQQKAEKEGISVFTGAYFQKKGVIVYGISIQKIDELVSENRPIDEIIEFVNSNNGAAVIAQPYKSSSIVPAMLDFIDGFAAVETVTNVMTDDYYTNIRAINLALNKGYKEIGGSAATEHYDAGEAFTKFKSDIQTEKELSDCLKHDEYIASDMILEFNTKNQYHRSKKKCEDLRWNSKEQELLDAHANFYLYCTTRYPTFRDIVIGILAYEFDEKFLKKTIESTDIGYYSLYYAIVVAYEKKNPELSELARKAIEDSKKQAELNKKNMMKLFAEKQTK